MNKIFSMLGTAIKTLTAKVEVHPKTSAADLLLMELMGEKCTLKFDRQDEVFEGVLRSSSNDAAWTCGASFEAHWLTAIEVNDDGSYTIYVRVPDDEFAEDLLSMDCDEMLCEDEENEGRSPDCEDWR